MPTISLTGANQAIVTNSGTPVYYRGLTLRETSGAAPATLRVWDNPSAASGKVLEEVTLTASQSTREYYDGKFAALGVFVEIVAGAIEGSIYI